MMPLTSLLSNGHFKARMPTDSLPYARFQHRISSQASFPVGGEDLEPLTTAKPLHLTRAHSVRKRQGCQGITDEGIGSRVKMCDSTERKKLSREEIQAIFMLSRSIRGPGYRRHTRTQGRVVLDPSNEAISNETNDSNGR